MMPATPSATATATDQRTYYVSDERLHAFGLLSHAQRLQWVGQCSRFVRLAQLAKARQDEAAQREGPAKSADQPGP